MKRYIVECDSPDGIGVYADCFGPNSKRGHAFEDYDDLQRAIVEAKAHGHGAWVWDGERNTYAWQK